MYVIYRDVIKLLMFNFIYQIKTRSFVTTYILLFELRLTIVNCVTTSFIFSTIIDGCKAINDLKIIEKSSITPKVQYL